MLVFAIIGIIIIILIFWCYKRQEHLSFYEMDDPQKLQFIVKTYFTPRDLEAEAVEKKRKAEDAYIASLPRNSDCPDQFSKCAEWAKNDECIINPEFMLYYCPKSCQSCTMNEEQKYNLVKIYNSRDPPHCVTHDNKEMYPNVFPYLYTLYGYD